MTICTICIDQCARSEAQLAIRKRNIASFPDIAIHPCENCGGTEWATTGEFVVAVVPSAWVPILVTLCGVFAVGLIVVAATLSLAPRCKTGAPSLAIGGMLIGGCSSSHERQFP